MKTLTPKADQIKQEWLLIDAKDQVLGRLATRVATLLRGKHKPQYCPHLEVGDNVIVINAEKVSVTGNKSSQKTYGDYSGYPGGLKQTPYSHMLVSKPDQIIKRAVKGMLPKNALGRKLLKNLKVYAGAEHPHVAQKPRAWEL